MRNHKTAVNIRSRIASRQDILKLFAVSLFPSHIVAFMLLFVNTQILMLKASLSELLAVFAYVLAFTLMESVVCTLLLVLLAAILPFKFFRDHLIPKGTLFIIIISIWAISLQPQGMEVTHWNIGLLFIVLMLALLITAHSEFVQKIMKLFVNWLFVLSAVYLFLDALSIVYLLIRANFF